MHDALFGGPIGCEVCLGEKQHIEISEQASDKPKPDAEERLRRSFQSNLGSTARSRWSVERF